MILYRNINAYVLTKSLINQQYNKLSTTQTDNSIKSYINDFSNFEINYSILIILITLITLSIIIINKKC